MYKVLSILLALHVSAIGLRVYANPIPPVPTDAHVTGHVIEKNGEHLPFSTIRLFPQEGEPIVTTTDATGHYFLKNLREGKYRIEASAAGYVSASKTVEVIRNRMVEVQFELLPDVIGLEQVVVTGNKNEVLRRGSASLVQVMSGKLLSDVSAACLADGLNFQPGEKSWATTALVADTEQTAPYYENRNRNWYFTANGYYTIDLKLGATPGDTKIIAYDYMASLPTEATASIDGAGPDYYATFSNIYSDMELSVAEGQTIQLYDVTVAGSTLTLTERVGGKVAQGEGVLVKASTPDITVTAISEGLVPAEFGTTTHLVATPGNEKTVAAEGGYKYYRLAYNKKSDKSGIGFYLTNADNGSLSAQPNKAYLKVPTASAGSIKSFVINPKPSHVEGIEISEQDADRTIYDLSGRRVENPAPGFYIQGNQKVIVK